MKFLRWPDIAAIVLVALASAASALPMLAADEGAYAVVEYDGGSLTLPLAADGEYPIESGGYHLTLRVEGGGVEVLAADCPDRLCVAGGPISRSGQTLICLPARVIIRIEGGDELADAVAG